MHFFSSAFPIEFQIWGTYSQQRWVFLWSHHVFDPPTFKPIQSQGSQVILCRKPLIWQHCPTQTAIKSCEAEQERNEILVVRFRKSLAIKTTVSVIYFSHRHKLWKGHVEGDWFLFAPLDREGMCLLYIDNIYVILWKIFLECLLDGFDSFKRLEGVQS